MPSKKKNALRTAQPIVSDYDTDTAGYTSAQQYNVPRKRTNGELNLAVLQRYDPQISRIHTIAPFAVVYLFSPEAQHWEKCGIEGSLFVCELSCGIGRPRWQVVILNRKSLDNFATELKSSDDVEITDEYIILQVMGADQVPSIYGLWIFSDGSSMPSSRDIVASAIVECAAKAEWYAANYLEPVGGHNGQDEYQDQGYDGGYVEPQQEHEAFSEEQFYSGHLVQQPPGQDYSTHQPVDLLSLFKGQQAQQHHKTQYQEQQHQQKYQSGAILQAPPQASYQAYPQQQFSNFHSNPDTDFLRAGAGPTIQQHQMDNPATQQNTLLNLFRK
ncbi:PH domain-like protein [Polychaeton citri CBS 116435]|uniref:PH domain-like protein n=1 Tax=Polychaeton citri CBS 116435 TaxID=1314669 RepID=A0A9P4Q4F6_9PEZI|nr:PH domain-like protein [Polychaeton citri CBS 116435]